MTAERYTVVLTGFLSTRKPGEYLYLTMNDDPVRMGDGGVLWRGRPPCERLRSEIPFQDLPEGCRRLALEVYRVLWELQRYGLGHRGIQPEVPTTLEAAVDFNPDDAQQYLEGVDYPASKEEVVSVAEQNGAPDAMIRMLEGLSRHEFSGQEQVLEDLRAFPQSNQSPGEDERRL